MSQASVLGLYVPSQCTRTVCPQPQTNDVYLFYFYYNIIILPQPPGVAGRRPFQCQATPGNISILY